VSLSKCSVAYSSCWNKTVNPSRYYIDTAV